MSYELLANYELERVYHRAKLDAYLPKLEEKCDQLLCEVWSSHADEKPSNQLINDYFSARKMDMKENLDAYKEKLKARLNSQSSATELAHKVDGIDLVGLDLDLDQGKIECIAVKSKSKRRQSFFQVLVLAGNLT